MNPSFDQIASGVIRQVLPRRQALRRMGQYGAGAVLATLPILRISNTALARSSQSIGGGDIVDVLNFALTLEYLEESFYRQGLAAAGLDIPSADRDVFIQIRDHELDHVNTLRATITALSGTPVTLTDDAFDFTGGDGTAEGPYDPFNDYPTFMALAQGFEDTGVRAYKGQAPNLQSNLDVLDAALQIHSVEARHASQVRRMRGQQGWIPSNSSGGLPPEFDAIYAGEGNTTQGGVDVTSISDVATEEITESFDEPLTMDAVLGIVDPFIIG